jgi:hypothetical protein
LPAMAIPDITRHPDRWFRYFDSNNNGLLDTQSVINGFCLTFPSVDRDILSSIITEMWPSKSPSLDLFRYLALSLSSSL